MESAMSSQDPFPPLIGFYGSSSQYYGERQNANCPKFYMICSFFACSLFASVYLSAIATINWQENPTITTLKVVLIFYSAVFFEAIPTYRVAEVGSLLASRVEICRHRHDWRSCKICASCVNFPRKQFLA